MRPFSIQFSLAQLASEPASGKASALMKCLTSRAHPSTERERVRELFEKLKNKEKETKGTKIKRCENWKFAHFIMEIVFHLVLCIFISFLSLSFSVCFIVLYLRTKCSNYNAV